ncbi:acetyl esterase [Actinoplanes lutulentus]|uniref:Acetyl esterase n=1 Tax=Actinoplanes lutulentus TaxID=1287878 RepID=A0A327Z1J7_9ACTN|nr:alpha/beta hydrolase fold domain-containing protein [Actinoplanes lutulentus]MBB2947573.1 acetyl esterase [Actinoplanes lutulentus]RAK27629.1 acetyl esterase [Actinoplanes lutulentus]
MTDATSLRRHWGSAEDVGIQATRTPDVAIETFDIDGQIRIRVVRPAGEPEVLPVVLFTHGAGWILGDDFTYDGLTRELALRARAAVVFVDYRHSGENRFPAAVQECRAALEWVIAHAARLTVDATRIAVAGDAAGAAIAVAVAMSAKDRLVGQVLLYPMIDGFDTVSYHRRATEHWIMRQSGMWRQVRRSEPAVVTRRADERLTGMPPALVVVAEADVLREQGEGYAAGLRAAGVSAVTERYEGLIHDFVMVDTLGETAAAKVATEHASAYLRYVLR